MCVAVRKYLSLPLLILETKQTDIIALKLIRAVNLTIYDLPVSNPNYSPHEPLFSFSFSFFLVARKQYVSTKKVQNAEITEPSSDKERLQTQDNYSCMQTPYTVVEAKDDEEEAYLAVLIKELNHKREEAAANSLLTLCNGGCSSTETEYHQTGQHTLPDCINTTDGSSSQVSEQATVETAASSSKDQTTVMIDQRNSFHDVYGGIDNNFEAGCNYLVFDHLTE